MKKIYHVFYYNAYDGLDDYGEKTEDQLKTMLNATGYDKLNTYDLLVIEGREVSDNELKAIKEG